MAFKDKIYEVANCRYRLDAGMAVPVEIFMTQQLIDESKEALWNEVQTIAAFPGVRKVVVFFDAHESGNGIPVGIAVETGDTVIMCAAGYDISCGMAAVETNLTIDDVRDNTLVRTWIDAVEERVATGAGRHRARRQRVISSRKFQEILERGALAVESDKTLLGNLERTHLPVDMGKLIRIEEAVRGEGQLGSEGGGNHFVELGVDVATGKVMFLIHTGSRGYGHGTATYFFNRGAELLGLPKKDKEKAYFRVDSVEGKAYLNHMNAAANYAIVNRLLIYRAVEEAAQEVFGAECRLYYEISHNLVQVENGRYIHRKGATRALPPGHDLLVPKWRETGHPIILPGSMGTASAILFAKPGTADSLYSINHGCGRVLGRKDAKRKYAERQSELNEEMDRLGILINTRNVPMDECLHAYKDIDEVLHGVESSGLAVVTHKLRPRAVIKGAD